MIEKRAKRCYVPICDCCGAELPFEESFFDATDAMEDAGWVYDSGTNENLCEECVPSHVLWGDWSDYYDDPYDDERERR